MASARRSRKSTGRNREDRDKTLVASRRRGAETVFDQDAGDRVGQTVREQESMGSPTSRPGERLQGGHVEGR